VVRDLHLPTQLYDVVEFFRHRAGASGPDSKAGLQLRDVFMLQPSATELVEFVSALKLCVRRFYESDSRELTSDEVAAELNMDSIDSESYMT
jgi:hypothetical protein